MRRSIPLLMGAKPAKKVPNPPFLHAAEKPRDVQEVDFKSLGLQFNASNEPKFTVPTIQWAPKPESTPSLPFAVDRTRYNTLPVYTDFKGGRTKVITLVRRIKGDVYTLKAEIEKVVGKEVELKQSGIKIDGNYSERIKLWLVSLGF